MKELSLETLQNVNGGYSNSYLIKQANKNYRNAVTVANLRGYNVYTYRKRR